jgi:AcrR family transcriptional regulator
MARRNDHSRDEIREMALKAAEDLLDRQGAAGLSTRKIAAEIGYTVGSLYLVFHNLDDLIVQVNARTLTQLAEWLDQATARGQDASAGLIELGRAYLHFAALHRGRWELIFDHRLTPGVLLPEWYRRQVLSLFARVEALLAGLAPNRPQADHALAARALWSGVHGVCTLALGGKLDIAGIADAEKLTDSLMLNYLSGWNRTV